MGGLGASRLQALILSELPDGAMDKDEIMQDVFIVSWNLERKRNERIPIGSMAKRG